jgi:hypothetical protein
VRKEIPSKYHCEKSKPPEWWHTETYPWGAFLFIVCINAFGKRKKRYMVGQLTVTPFFHIWFGRARTRGPGGSMKYRFCSYIY